MSFIMTINSDDEVPDDDDSSSDEEKTFFSSKNALKNKTKAKAKAKAKARAKAKKAKMKAAVQESEIDDTFIFDDGSFVGGRGDSSEPAQSWNFKSAIEGIIAHKTKNDANITNLTLERIAAKREEIDDRKKRRNKKKKKAGFGSAEEAAAAVTKMNAKAQAKKAAKQSPLCKMVQSFVDAGVGEKKAKAYAIKLRNDGYDELHIIAQLDDDELCVEYKVSKSDASKILKHLASIKGEEGDEVEEDWGDGDEEDEEGIDVEEETDEEEEDAEEDAEEDVEEEEAQEDEDEGEEGHDAEEDVEEEEAQEDEDEGEEGDEDEEEDDVTEEEKLQASLAAHKQRLKDEGADSDDADEAAMQAQYFDLEAGQEAEEAAGKTFSDMGLSRPIMRAIDELGFVRPTPIQRIAVPTALSGKDLTGSGKTAAFLLPCLERLLYREKRVAVTRVLVITPTRELATQCQSMFAKLAKYTDASSCLVVGGMQIREQEAQLRRRPDVVICTPGRMIDHVRNSHSIHMEGVEVLVLDEADRLLELGFKDEVHELVRGCPPGRQTMLFSATMTTSVDELVELSLNRPVRLKADVLFDMSKQLIQEFVRVKKSREDDREAILLALCRRTFTSRTIVFFEQKWKCHRAMIVFGLAGLKAAELHGNLTQLQRLQALEDFKDEKVDILLCTDLAGRGIDIQGVEAVINYEMPKDLTNYVHRVGRTARAGRRGRAVTLTGESRRLLMKQVVRHCKGVAQSRSVPAHIIAQWRERIETMEPDVQSILEEEKLEKSMRVVEMEMHKAKNTMNYQEEIMRRPAKTWFQTPKEKTEVQEAAKQAREAADEAQRKADELELLRRRGAQGAAAREEALRLKRKKERERELTIADVEGPKPFKSHHRLNRKKRRRLVMLKELAQDEREWAEARGEKWDGGFEPAKALEAVVNKQKANNKKRTKMMQSEDRIQSSEAVTSKRQSGISEKGQSKAEKRRAEKEKKKQDRANSTGFETDLNDRAATVKEKKGKRALAQTMNDIPRNWVEKKPLPKGSKKMSASSFKSKSRYKRKRG